MDITIFLFVIIVLIFSAIIHEISHGAVADWLGDPTARLAGRLTLNPVVHVDYLGSIILPLLLFLPALFGLPTVIFGWAKPVPYNPNMLKNPVLGAALIAGAGPASNLLLALIFGTIIRTSVLNPVLVSLLGIIVWVNILLGIFNLVPIPPLDGSKILTFFFPRGGLKIAAILERYGIIVLLLFIFFGFQLLTPIITWFYWLFTGSAMGF